MRPINEQVVVITGASSGIGRETALQFGQRGASVVLAARNLVALDLYPNRKRLLWTAATFGLVALIRRAGR